MEYVLGFLVVLTVINYGLKLIANSYINSVFDDPTMGIVPLDRK